MKNDYILAPSGGTKRAAIPNFLSGFNTNLDEAVLKLDVAKRIENFDFSSGALTEGYGLAEAGLGIENAAAVWEYSRWDADKELRESILMYLGADGRVFYSWNGNAFEVLENAVFTSAPYTVNYRLYGEDVILMCSPQEGMLMWNGAGAASKIDGAPAVTSLCMHYERMFATVGGEKNAVYFSDDLDPTNWNENLNEGGFIQMLDERGALNKAVSFLNYVYVFRDRGVSRITAYADQSEFFATNLYVASGRIYPGSVTLCLDTVMFLADDGLYRFEGLSAARVLPQINGILAPSPGAKGFFYGGKYFLSLNTKNAEGEADTGGQNNTLLAYDLKSGAYQILTGINITGFFAYSEKVYAITDGSRVGELNKCGAVFGTPTIKTWESGLKDFGTERIKRVREFNVDASAPFSLIISTERGEKRFDAEPEKGITSIRVNASGRKIGVKLLSCEEKIRIVAPSLKLTLT